MDNQSNDVFIKTEPIDYDQNDLSENTAENLNKSENNIEFNAKQVKIEIKSESQNVPDCDMISEEVNIKDELMENEKVQDPLDVNNYLQDDQNGVDQADDSSSSGETELTNETDHSCQGCNLTFEKMSDLVVHMHTSHTKNTFTCDLCPKMFSTETSRNTHLKTHINVFLCKICFKGFRNKISLAKHKRHHIEDTSDYPKLHENEEKTFKCDICSAMFAKYHAYCRHRRIHRDEKPFACDLCERKFNRLRHLEQHQPVHKYDSEKTVEGSKEESKDYTLTIEVIGARKKNRFTCNYCEKFFRRVQFVERHVRRHIEGNEYKCEICKKIFYHKDSLEKHKPIHDRQFPCKLCNVVFKQNVFLVRHHKAVHSSEKPFACTHCDFKFALKDGLHKHLRTHTGEKPHACDLCDRSFATTSTLKDHKRIHTGERPFVCNICNKSFTQKSALSTHRKGMHKMK